MTVIDNQAVIRVPSLCEVKTLDVPIPQYYFHSSGYSVQKIMWISEAFNFFQFQFLL